MLEYNDRIIELAETLLKDGRVDMVIGFRKGTVPMMNEPCFIKNPEDSRLLVWDSNCGINLANYLTDRKEKIGIIAKGCDSRNIVVHIVENKIKREQLHIIGEGLLEYETLTGDEIKALLKGKPPIRDFDDDSGGAKATASAVPSTGKAKKAKPKKGDEPDTGGMEPQPS